MDTLEILVTRLPDAYAGENRIACADVSLTGTAENYSGVLWMSSGDGSFSSPNDLNTMYHMGPSDIENQNVVISLNVGSNAPCFTFSSDSIALNLDVPEILSSNLEDKTLMVGDQLMLDFEVASQMEGTYQWYFNDQPLTATLDGTLIFNNLQPAQAGSYYCIYSNGCEETLSDTAFVTLYEQYFQTINVKLGWNAISSYIYPSNSSMEAVLNPILDNLIILFNDNGLFYPDHELMTFSNWNVNTGYILKTNDEASFEISGITKYPRQPINVPPGWSLFPVNITCVVHVEDLFIAYPEIQSIKEIGGLELYWPQMGIMTLENIHPGKAYEIFNASDTEISITFPGCED
jgi:hypothetical protein